MRNRFVTTVSTCFKVYPALIDQIEADSSKMGIIPSKEKFMAFVRSRKYVNYTSIAKAFDINKGTVQTLVETYANEGLVRETKVGSNKFVEVVEKGQEM